MFRDEKLELKVGLFMGAGFFLMFLVVFFLRDFSLFDKGYNIQVIFDTVGGITKNAPVKLAGINVGEVKFADIFQDKTEDKPRVKLDVRVDGNISIPEDAVVRINTLGLLGEKYLEITPGVSKKYLAEGGIMMGENPISVSRQMEKMNAFMESAVRILKKIENGDGTLGKLLSDSTLYDDVEIVMSRLRNGDGTLGKLLVKEDIYDNVEEFTSDIKENPWKLLHKTRNKTSKEK